MLWLPDCSFLHLGLFGEKTLSYYITYSFFILQKGLPYPFYQLGFFWVRLIPVSPEDIRNWLVSVLNSHGPEWFPAIPALQLLRPEHPSWVISLSLSYLTSNRLVNPVDSAFRIYSKSSHWSPQLLTVVWVSLSHLGYYSSLLTGLRLPH